MNSISRFAVVGKLFFYLGLSLLISINTLGEDTKREEANALLAKASQISDQKPRYHLEVKFIFYHLAGGNMKGNFVQDYVSPEQWQEKTEFDGYREIRVRRDKNEWLIKNSTFEPILVTQLRKLLPPNVFTLDKTDVVRK